MKHKVAELEGALLDAAVAKAEGKRFAIERHAIPNPDPFRNVWCWLLSAEGKVDFDVGPYRPSQDWQHGGPIIERDRIELSASEDGSWDSSVWTKDGNHLGNGDFSVHTYGPTPLIAAMRAYVAAKLGEEVDL